MTIEPPLAADEEQASVDAAWKQTIARRLDEVLSGSVELIPEDEAERQISALIAKYV